MGQVFGQYSTQKEVFNEAVAPIVDEVLQGYNCTVFAYGQTGTGKTYTMEGDIGCPENAGVIPRSVRTIFEKLDNIGADYTVRVSFLELYNEVKACFSTLVDR
jgi:kinesin family protein 11